MWDIDASWLLTIYLMCKLVGTFSGDLIVRLMGLRMATGCGIFSFIISFIMANLVVRHSIWAVALTFATVGGMGSSITFMCSLVYLADWFPRTTALVISMAFGSTAVGGTIINQIITSYINPTNLNPDESLGGIPFFSQLELLDRVPNVFLVLCGFTAAVQMVGFCLLKKPPEKNDFDNGEESHLLHNSSNSLENRYAIGRRHSDQSVENIGENSQTSKGCALQNGSNELHLSHTLNVDAHGNGSRHRSTKNQPSNENLMLETSMTPLQMLKSPTFYLLQSSIIAQSLGYILVLNYFKIFGQLWINDDKFLAFVASTMSFFIIFSMLICGPVIEKFGIKNTLIGHLAVASVFLSIWYFIARFSRWWYLIWVIVLGSIHYNSRVMFPLLALQYFGKDFYAVNYGLIQVTASVVFLVGPPLFAWLLATFGWFGLFLCISLVSFLAMMIIMCTMK